MNEREQIFIWIIYVLKRIMKNILSHNSCMKLHNYQEEKKDEERRVESHKVYHNCWYIFLFSKIILQNYRIEIRENFDKRYLNHSTFIVHRYHKVIIKLCMGLDSIYSMTMAKWWTRKVLKSSFHDLC